MRLSPALSSGMKRCAIARWRPPSVSVSRITLMFGSPARARKIDFPPMPSRVFSTASPCSAMNALMMAASRLTIVGGQHCGNYSAVALRQAEDLGVVHERRVDRRILAHQHDLARAEHDV